MNLKKGTTKVLALAIGGVVFAEISSPMAQANSGLITWASTSNASWLVPGNWLGGVVPGMNLDDVAVFPSAQPPSNTVTISSDTSVGAIYDSYNSGTALTINGASPSTLTLNGATFSIQQGSSVLASQANTILALGSTAATAKSLTLGSSLNLVLSNATNYIVGMPGSSSKAGGTITINSNISQASGVTAGLSFLGAGSSQVVGTTVILNGTNTFTGGMVIGGPVVNPGDPVTQGMEVQVASPAALPTTGNITVYDQSQLQFNTTGLYGSPTQMLTLNGDGQNPSNFSSGALRTGGATGTYTWQGAVTIGAANGAGDPNTPYVVISVTSSPAKILILNGHVTGTGNLQKQGAGLLRFSGASIDYTGNTQIGNGVISVEPGSNLGRGELSFAQTSTNTATVNLFNATQTIANLNSTFGDTTDSGAPTQDLQALNLGGNLAQGLGGTFSGTATCALTINQTRDTTFGYLPIVNAPTETSTIQGPGSVEISSTSDHSLTLNGPNTYTGGTKVSGGTLNLANGSNGSATGTGSVEVGSFGHLATGNAMVLSFPVSDGRVGGDLQVDGGGVVAPGNDNLAGTLSVGGNLILNDGAKFSLDITGVGKSPTTGFDQVKTNGTLSFASGAAQISLLDSSTVTGTLELLSYASSTFGGTFEFGNGSVSMTNGGRQYTLFPESTGLFLGIVDNSSVRLWSVGGGTPSQDGGGVWSNNGTANFYISNPTGTDVANGTFLNADNTNVVIGNGGGGGQITLGTSVRVGGTLVFGPNTSPYTIGVPSDTHTLTLVKGISATGNATINAPVILEQSQTVSPQDGVTVTSNGGITDGGHTFGLTKSGAGTFVMNGTSTYTGGTTVSVGALQTTTWGLPLAGPASSADVVDNASLVFSNPSSGTFSGRISGSGSVTVNNSVSTAIVKLTNVSNSYSGATVLQGGVLNINNPAELGSGAGGIILNGGTLQAGGNMTFPLGSPARRFNINTGTSTIDTNGSSVTFNQTLTGQGTLVKAGAGTLTLTGLVNAVVIGNIAVSGGTLVLNPAASAGFGVSASSTDSTTFAGGLTLAGGLELRMYGGYFSGGGSFSVKSTGINMISRMPNTVIGNRVVLDDNTTGIPGFVGNFGATTANELQITNTITGLSDVDFTGGAGTVLLTGSSSYTGTNAAGTGPNPNGPLTTIDNSSGGEVQIGANNVLPLNTRMHITSTGLLDLNGFSLTVAALDSSSSTNSAEITNNSGSSTGTIIINGSGTTSVTSFDGLLEDGSGTVALHLAAGNSGNLTLTNISSTYTGGTTLSGGTLTITKDSQLGAETGTLVFDGGNLATNSLTTGRPITVNATGGTIDIAAGKSMTINGDLLGGGMGGGTLNWNGGTLNTIDSGTVSFATVATTVSVTPGSTVAIGSNNQVTVDATEDPFTDSSVSTNHVAIVNNGAFTVTAGSATIAKHTGTGIITVNAGATLHLAASGIGNSAGALSIDAAGKLDLANNGMVVNYTGGTPDGSIRAALLTGYASGAWNGPGIDSSTSHTDSISAHPTAIGYAEATTLHKTGTFFGQSIGANAILMRYTYAGDANLDGVVNLLDLNAIATNFGAAGTLEWDQGDFTYNDHVTIDDFNLLAMNYGLSQPAPSAPLALGAPISLEAPLGALVPEPITAPLLLASLILTRRRRSNPPSI